MMYKNHENEIKIMKKKKKNKFWKKTYMFFM